MNPKLIRVKLEAFLVAYGAKPSQEDWAAAESSGAAAPVSAKG